MANLIIKSSADNLVLQGSDASPAITLGATGTTTFAENATYSGGAKGAGLKSMQIFTSTSDTSWTKPSGVNTVKVYCTGGGGGGGGPGNSDDSGGGGGAGGTAIRIYDVSSVANVTIVIGTGGASAGVDGSGTNNDAEGGAGGTSSFAGPSQTITATGGGGGYDGNSGGAGPGDGGIGTGDAANTIIITGSQGHRGSDSNNDWSYAGHGGYSFWTGAPDSRLNYNYGGTRLDATMGNGGGGGTAINAGTESRSGVGGAGVIIVEEYS